MYTLSSEALVRSLICGCSVLEISCGPLGRSGLASAVLGWIGLLLKPTLAS